MGLKTPKLHSGLLKNIKSFTKFHSAQQNELYALIQKTYISALLTTPKPLTVWITINCGKF